MQFRRGDTVTLKVRVNQVQCDKANGAIIGHSGNGSVTGWDVAFHPGHVVEVESTAGPVPGEVWVPREGREGSYERHVVAVIDGYVYNRFRKYKSDLPWAPAICCTVDIFTKDYRYESNEPLRA